MTEFRSFDPRDASPRVERAEATASEIDRAITRVRAGFERWRRTALHERAEALQRLGTLLEDRSAPLGALMAAEMGKPVTQGVAEAKKCAWACRYAADKASEWLAPEVVATEARSEVHHEPMGPILAIMPWNFPFWQLFRFGASALAAGNTILLKHAPNVPECAEAILDVCREAGLDDGQVVNVFARVDQIEAILADRRVAGVTLTGSTRAGIAVASLAGKYLKPSVLELGGSDPFLVLSDADVDRAAAVAAGARLQNNGQSCIAAKRFIVEAPVAAAFIERLRSHLAAAVVGDPLDPSTGLGPMARRDLRDELHAQVARSVAQGARCVLGGAVPERPGFWYPATLLVDVTPGMPVWEEETFGPAAAVRVVRDAAEAVAVAAASPYALGASVWTADRDRARAIANDLPGGAVFVNAMVKSDPRLPFGGNGISGWGRELGREGMRAFTQTKTLWIE
jgi:succinate-semialdehyde dehydrogenase/glutarate-semialdehyde dehydrogenase